jgi:hypothetical protein
MGWSLFEPIVRTDSVPGPGTACKAGPLGLDLGPKMWQGWFLLFFFFFLSFLFFFPCFRDSKLITLFLILVGSFFFYLGMGAGWWR